MVDPTRLLKALYSLAMLPRDIASLKDDKTEDKAARQDLLIRVGENSGVIAAVTREVEHLREDMREGREQFRDQIREIGRDLKDHIADWKRKNGSS